MDRWENLRALPQTNADCVGVLADLHRGLLQRQDARLAVALQRRTTNARSSRRQRPPPPRALSP
eukprot:9726946-Lingulodinium_polyedra.AAC.1